MGANEESARKNFFKQFFLNDNNILLLVIINAVVIFISGYSLSERMNFFLSLVDIIITSLFVLELIVKLLVFGSKYFNSNWNKFDFLIILISIPAIFAFFFNTNFNDLSYLLIFRMLRVFKSFRFIKFVPGINHLIKGIARALKASLIVIIGFLMYVFIIGIFSFYLFRESSSDYFQTPLSSIYSTFKIFTVEGWYEIPEELSSNLSNTASFFTYIFFIFVVLSGGIFGLSLVNSIFVDAMVSDNNDELEKKIDKLEEKIDLLLKNSKFKP